MASCSSPFSRTSNAGDRDCAPVLFATAKTRETSAQHAANRTKRLTALENILIGSLSRDAQRRISLSHSAVDNRKERSTPFPRGPSAIKSQRNAGIPRQPRNLARTVFWLAGIWELAVITPLYFFFDPYRPERSAGQQRSGLFLRLRGMRLGLAGGLLLPSHRSRPLSAVDDSLGLRKSHLLVIRCFKTRPQLYSPDIQLARTRVDREGGRP